ncbi:MAG: hypothetical protein A4E72_01177 [Syntrophus sp. PtaU1.Bin208]|nr:MAG: hypothetical protein A4E72_01177 [Syntrophus sp. PtaU1.Bin208]
MRERISAGSCPGLSRRAFLRSLLIASGAVLLGPQGLLEAAPLLSGGKDWPLDWPTFGAPILADAPRRIVKLYTRLQLRHLTETTSHWGIGYSGGKLADKFILVSPAEPVAFHDALVRIGARAGNNLPLDGYGKFVGGDRLILSAQWPGLPAPVGINEIFYDSAGKGFDIRFGGNRIVAAEKKTGCLTCLESCPIGISSNAVYPHLSTLQRIVRPNSSFRGKPERLPNKDAVPVVVFYQLAARTG